VGTTATEHAVLFQDAEGPIESLSWGSFVIRGAEHGQHAGERLGKGKDIRVVGEKVTRWKDREGHRLKKSMITGVYGEDLEALVLGIGVEGAVEVPEKVRKAIEEHGIAQIYTLPTPDACAMYNKLYREGKRVALLAHGTC
jgi:hypothetical protein